MPVTQSRQAGEARQRTREELFTWSRPATMDPSETNPQGADPARPASGQPAPGSPVQPPAQTPAQPVAATGSYLAPNQATMQFVGYGPDGQPVYQPAGAAPQPPAYSAAPAQQPVAYQQPVYTPPHQPLPPQYLPAHQSVAPQPVYQPNAGHPAGGYPPHAEAPRGPWLTPLRVTIAALILAVGVGLLSLLASRLARPAGPEPPPPRPAALLEAEQELDGLKSAFDELMLKRETLLQQIEKRSPGIRPGLSQTRSPIRSESLAGLARLALVSPRFAILHAATPWLAMGLTAVVTHAAGPAEPAGGPASASPVDWAERHRNELADIKAQQRELKREAGRLAQEIKWGEERLKRLVAFDQADLILLEQGNSAVAVDIERAGDQVKGYVMKGSARAGGVAEIAGLVRRADRLLITDRGSLARSLRKLKPGSRVTQPGDLKQLQEIWKPRRYVPDGVDVNKMVTFKRIDRRFDATGSSQHVFGYLVDSSDDSVTVATASAVDRPLGVEEFTRADVIGFPVVAEGVELLQLEPQLEFLDYAILRAAKELANPGQAVHQAVAVKMDIQVNPAFVKRLSAYSAETDISWFAVARDDEQIGEQLRRGDIKTQGPAFRYVLEKLAAAAEDRLMQSASNLGLPLVTRDRKTMLALLEEQRIRGRESNPLPGRVLRAMNAAAERGNLMYANITHEGRKRRVVFEKKDEQAFQSFAQERGGHSWRGASGGYTVGAYGGGYGYGGGGSVHATPGGVAYGYGGGGGFGGGSVTYGASAAGEDLLYHNDRLFQSRGQQTYLSELNDEEARDAYQSVVYAEQVAKRDAELTIAEYGELAHATHVLRLTVEEGKAPDTVRYAVSLVTTPGGYEKQLGSAELPIERRPRELGSYPASGRLVVINPDEGRVGLTRGDEVLQRPLRVTPRNDSTRDRIPALVVETIPYEHPTGAEYRGLFDGKPLAVDPDWIDGEPEPLRVGQSLKRVPPTNRLRVMVHEILRRVLTPAGEVVAVSDDGRTARVRLIDAEKLWKPGERLLVERASGGLVDDGVPFYQRLPFDLKVNKCQGNTVEVRCDDPAELLWMSGEGLQVGDRVVTRYAERPRVKVRQADFYFTNASSFDKWRRDDTWKEKHRDRDPRAFPDDESMRYLFKTKGWGNVEGQLRQASAHLANVVQAALVEAGVDAAYTTATTRELTDAGETDKLVHFYLVPKYSRARRKAYYFLGMTLYNATPDIPPYNLEFRIRLQDLIEWRPIAE